MDIKKNNVQVDNSEGIINEDNEMILENVTGGVFVRGPQKNLNQLSPTQNPTYQSKTPTQKIV